ncbi:valine--pyruvate transaminase [Shewanella sp. NFH-SH190041]|uniref:valine--pyruvate transaminase n=1 Tax=Shewanella sp. NFH-SH190041 TaxID=2950245 RepID=UPI0021C2D91A|nr:valine--pyruvate transaminase [Shewanella sp. NFH-SH190041]BDM65224.1 valine--pyruvate transaminase [Shewanella sp. NFH-SH190041]
MNAFSRFGEKFNRYAGITQLMDDLNDGLRTPGVIMLGGGNPAAIPAMQDYFHRATASLLESGELLAAMSNYDGPRGNDAFIHALASLLQQTYDWPVTANNISLTNGSQSAFFALFNLLAGPQRNGIQKKILLPLAPEYIGYRDAGLEDELFVACRPQITRLEGGMFKYHVDFSALPLDEDIAAICVSRPTNPTGNVLTDDEIHRLDALAQQRGIPLIIDSAYGTPFPNIIFTKATPLWHDNIVLSMSLSKLGLPGLRCGIVIASEAITQALTNINGIVSLSPGGMGPVVAGEMIASGTLLPMSREVIRPYYQHKAQQAVVMLQAAIDVPGFHIHQPQGAIFLWLWFEGLPITTLTLYRRLKARGVLVVPGEYFFFGMSDEDDNWRHRSECIRMNYVQDEDSMRRGIEIIAEEVKKAWQN